MAPVALPSSAGRARREHAAGYRDRLHLAGAIVDGRYLVEAAVGAGGFGVVYRARHIQFDSLVALKVLVRVGTEDLTSFGRALRASRKEGQLLFRLASLHPSFVRVYESGLIDRESRPALPYLVLEWLEGVTLKAHLEALRRAGKSLSISYVLHLFDDLAEGLGMAHARRVAHRDLKPANVFLSVSEDRVATRLLDFGLAKEGTPTGDPHDDTSYAACPFTPAYGAPEQWDRSLGATGPWTDVYALALMLVELLRGCHWSRGAAAVQLMTAALDPAVRPTPRTLDVAVSDAVESVFSKALAVDPRRRYADVRSFWQALRAAAEWNRPERAISVAELGLAADPMPAEPVLGPVETRTSNPARPRASPDAQRHSPREDSEFSGSCRPSCVDSIARLAPSQTAVTIKRHRQGWGVVGGLGLAMLLAAGSAEVRSVPSAFARRTEVPVAGQVPPTLARPAATHSGTTAASRDQHEDGATKLYSTIVPTPSARAGPGPRGRRKASPPRRRTSDQDAGVPDPLDDSPDTNLSVLMSDDALVTRK